MVNIPTNIRNHFRRTLIYDVIDNTRDGIFHRMMNEIVFLHSDIDVKSMQQDINSGIILSFIFIIRLSTSAPSHNYIRKEAAFLGKVLEYSLFNYVRQILSVLSEFDVFSSPFSKFLASLGSIKIGCYA